ncbi:MAG: CBS domain-containing protein, partial [Pararhizobium sp.]
VETVATAPNASVRELKISVPAGATLEEAARAMTLAGASEIAVVDAESQAIGVLTLPQAVDAMVNSRMACSTSDAKKIA